MVLNNSDRQPGPLRRILLLALLASCSSTNPWHVDSISAGDTCFNSTRLKYTSSDIHPSLVFEMLRIDNGIEAFLSLPRSRLSPSCKKVLLTIRGIAYEEAIVPHEGRMRVRLPEATTSRLIQALQDGEKVSILMDGFEENLEPDQFSNSFAKFLGQGQFFQNFLKGPFP